MAVIRLTDRTGSWRTRLAARHCRHCAWHFGHFTLDDWRRHLSQPTSDTASTASCAFRTIAPEVSLLLLLLRDNVCVCVSFFWGWQKGNSWRALDNCSTKDKEMTFQARNNITHSECVFSKENAPPPQHLVKTLNGFPTVFCEYPWRGLHSNYAVSSEKE